MKPIDRESLIFNLTISELQSLIDEGVKKALEKLRCVKSCQNSQQNEILNLDEASKLTRLAKSTIYGLVSQRKIPFFKRGRVLRFKRSELIEWIESGRKKTVDEIRQEADQKVIKLNSKNNPKL